MLTLGLMEGVLSATVGLLILMGAANENAPLHRIFGPLVTVTVGFTAYLIHDSGRVTSAGDVAGLAVFGFIGFFAPVGVMRAVWKAMKRMAEVPAPPEIQRRPELSAAPRRTASPQPTAERRVA